MPSPRSLAFESADTVNRVVALLVRFPEIHSVRSNPAEGSLTLSFAVRKRLDRAQTRAFGEKVAEHVRALLDLGGSAPERIAVNAQRDPAVTFVTVTRDAESFSRGELELVVALFADAFGDALVRDDAGSVPVDDDPGARDEQVEVSLDALRDPAQRQRLVGFREEQRVLVYFAHAPKRVKARARS
jgi:catabolite regulation protein CreA